VKMMPPQLLSKWVNDSARDRDVKEISAIQSEWPAHSTSGVASGYRYPDAGSCSILLSCPSSRWFKARTLWLDNYGNNKDRTILYVGGSAGSCSATIGGFWVGARETELIAIDTINVGGDIWASGYLGSVAIRIGGILLQSGPEN